MRVALHTSFAATKKEPLADMLDRVRLAFLNAGLGEPPIRFTFGDAPVESLISSVDRVLKRYPAMQPFLATNAPVPGLHETKRLSNGPMSPAAGQPVDFSTIRAIAAGVPRSFPFHNVAIHFHDPAFGEMTPGASSAAGFIPGVMVMDSWWVNGRNRSLSAFTVVDADTGRAKLPPPPPAVAALMAALGKAKRTMQVPFSVETAAAEAGPPQAAAVNPNPEAAKAVRAIVEGYRGRMKELVEQAGLPHDLPLAIEALRDSGPGVTPGPMKPALERVFKPMGYDCRGGTGTFTLRRRTPGNLAVELYLDVGTWSHSVTAIFRVLGVGFKATLVLPVTVRALDAGQYRIGDAERWRKIVENLAALVAELDRSFVPEIEHAAGPSPEWFQPEG